MDPITYSSFQWDKRKNQIIIILFSRRMNFPWYSDKSWRRLVCFFAAAVIWRIFLLFAFSDGWIGFFLAEIVHPFGWIWRFGRFSRPFSTHSLWFFHIGLKKVGLTLSLRDLCSESLVMHSLFIRQSFTQIGPLKPRNSKKKFKLIWENWLKNGKTPSIGQIIWSCFYKKLPVINKIPCFQKKCCTSFFQVK